VYYNNTVHTKVYVYNYFGYIYNIFFQIFRSFSRHFYYANSWKKHETVEAHFETTDRQAAINNDNNIELQELNYHPIFRTK